MTLPERANLEHLRQQAKDLLSAFRVGDPAAIVRISAHFPDLKALTLVRAQLVIAREYGFPSWTKLRARVEASSELKRHEQADLVAEQLIKGDFDGALAMLTKNPELPSHSSACACATGSVDVVRTLLQGGSLDPRGQIGTGGWSPLVYVCFSRFGREESARERMLATARLLLEAGADPNSRWANPAYDNYSESCLYGAVGTNDFPAMTKLLLESGATPNDGECFYHSAECRDSQNLELLLKHGVSISESNAFLRHLDFEHPDWIRMIVAKFDPATLPPAIPHALQRNRTIETIRVLVEAGVDANAVDQWGRRPYATAYRLGRHDVCDLLVEHGAAKTLSEADEVLGAIARGESVTGRGSSDLISALNGDIPPQILVYAQSGDARGVRELLKLGVDPNRPGQNGEYPIHQACYFGHADAAISLIDGGADPTMREPIYDGTAWGWLGHGSFFASPRPADSEYARIAERLVAFGLPTDADYDACPAVMEVIRRYTPA